MEGGVYCLLLLSLGEGEIGVGSLGRIRLKRGYYCYVGSALGGVLSRVRRHLTGPGRIRWHIDYLTSSPRIVPMTAVYGLTNERLEDEVYDLVPGEEVPGFGASDSPRGSHLRYLGEDLREARSSAERAVSGVGLDPRYLEAAEAVLMDLDGTLTDYPEVREEAIRAVAGSEGVDPGFFSSRYREARDRVYRTRSGPDRFSKLGVFLEMGLPPERAAMLEREYWGQVLSRISSYPDAGVVHDLRRAGFRVCILSDGARRIQLSKMRAAGLDPGDFDGLVFSGDVGRNKDEAGCYEAALDLLGLAPHNAVMVGDSPDQDVLPALSAGVRPILVDRGRSAGRVPGVPRVGDLWELPGMLILRRPSVWRGRGAVAGSPSR